MNLFYKILIFSILSFSLPIGKLFELFIWDNRITKTETVFERRINAEGRNCQYVKVIKEINKKLSVHLQNKSNFLIIEKVNTQITKQILYTQKIKFNNIKRLVNNQYMFNLLYVDDSEDIFKVFI